MEEGIYEAAYKSSIRKEQGPGHRREKIDKNERSKPTSFIDQKLTIKKLLHMADNQHLLVKEIA